MPRYPELDLRTRVGVLGAVKLLEYTAFLTALFYIPSGCGGGGGGGAGGDYISGSGVHRAAAAGSVYYCGDLMHESAVTAGVSTIILLLLLPILLPFGGASPGSHPQSARDSPQVSESDLVSASSEDCSGRGQEPVRPAPARLLLLFVLMLALELVNLMWLFVIRVEWSAGEPVERVALHRLLHVLIITAIISYSTALTAYTTCSTLCALPGREKAGDDAGGECEGC